MTASTPDQSSPTTEQSRPDADVVPQPERSDSDDTQPDVALPDDGSDDDDA